MLQELFGEHYRRYQEVKDVEQRIREVLDPRIMAEMVAIDVAQREIIRNADLYKGAYIGNADYVGPPLSDKYQFPCADLNWNYVFDEIEHGDDDALLIKVYMEPVMYGRNNRWTIEIAIDPAHQESVRKKHLQMFEHTIRGWYTLTKPN